MVGQVLKFLDPDDFPALYRSADRTSLDAQRRFLVVLRVRLGGLLAAAVGAAVSWELRTFQVGGLISLLAFAVALTAELYIATAQPDRVWYEGRAAAESAKTLTWRFVVRGEPFGDSTGLPAERDLLARLDEILQDLPRSQAGTREGGAPQITQKMRELRSQSFMDRRDLYLGARLRAQQVWYARNAAWNEKRARRWLAVSIAFEFLGVAGAMLRAFNVVDVDLLGPLAAAAAAITAWAQAKQYERLTTTYGVTASALASVASEAEGITEEDAWDAFVGRAEEVIGREHTVWRAARGVDVEPPGSGQRT